MKDKQSERKYTFSGIILTCLVSAGIVFGIFHIFNRKSANDTPSSSEIRANEIKAFHNIKLIVDAQNKYIETDWDEDGKKTFAAFIIHLWTTLDKDKNPVNINLIPKKLGSVLDGYKYVSLLAGKSEDHQSCNAFDYEKEWAVMAISETIGNKITLIVNQSGSIYAKQNGFIEDFPYDPEEAGWLKIENLQQLPHAEQ